MILEIEGTDGWRNRKSDDDHMVPKQYFGLFKPKETEKLYVKWEIFRMNKGEISYSAKSGDM